MRLIELAKRAIGDNVDFEGIGDNVATAENLALQKVFNRFRETSGRLSSLGERLKEDGVLGPVARAKFRIAAKTLDCPLNELAESMAVEGDMSDDDELYESALIEASIEPRGIV